jgi:hypothetical protein
VYIDYINRGGFSTRFVHAIITDSNTPGNNNSANLYTLNAFSSEGLSTLGLSSGNQNKTARIGIDDEPSTSNEAIRSVISDYLSVISFLVGSSSFVLGLYATVRASTTKDRYYKAIVTCIALPALILIILGIFLIFNISYFQYYLAIFSLLFVPIIAILILTYKL